MARKGSAEPGSWRYRARQEIATLLVGLGNLTDADKRAVLLEAYPWGPRRMLPYKVWCQEVRRVIKQPPQSQDNEPDLFSGDTMTEHDWLTSTDPAAMLAHVKDRATERQYEFFCRAAAFMFWKEPVKVCPWPTWARWAHEWTRTGEHSLIWRGIRDGIVDDRCSALRCIFGNPWRPVYYKAKPESYVGKFGKSIGAAASEIRGIYPDILCWNDRTIPRLAASVYERECPKCEGGWIVSRVRDEDGEYSRTSRARCLQCKGSGRLTDPDWSLLSIIADALEEAGCTSQELLMHLRGQERCSRCMGSGRWLIADRSGYMDYWTACKCENGWRPMPHGHVRGCFAVELLLQEAVDARKLLGLKQE